MKIIAVCGSGLATSFMVAMNIRQVLSELKITGVEVGHAELDAVTADSADVFFLTKDIAPKGKHLGKVVELESIINLDELREKVIETMKDYSK